MFVEDAFVLARHVAYVLSSSDLLAALHRLRDESKTTNADLSRLLKLPSSRITEIFDGKRKVTIDEAKLIVEHFGLVSSTDRSPDRPPTRSVNAGKTAPVTRLNLSYLMGPGTDLDASYLDGEAFEFDIGFLRSMTITPPERIRIVDGIGDSMQPTLHDRDLLFVDVNQASLNAQDRIWTIWLFELGAVKRLRVIDKEKVLVISDSPDVANQTVNRKDVIIHGRVVGSIKRH